MLTHHRPKHSCCSALLPEPHLLSIRHNLTCASGNPTCTRLQNGRAKLPEVFVTDKNDTFHFGDGATTGHFRLLALAMRRDELGNPVPVEGVAPAVSNTFVVSVRHAVWRA